MREYGSEHPAVVLPDQYFELLACLKREMHFLRSGREALLLAAFSCKKMIRPRENIDFRPIILIPAYCCWSMYAPFEKAGWTIKYYRLNEDLTVDTEYMNNVLEKEKPHAVLTMNYFGSSPTNETVSVIRRYEELFNDKVIIIEDFSHCTFSLKQIYNPQVDIYISSIRKSIGICDGALILSDIKLNTDLIREQVTDFTEVRYEAQVEKGRYNWNNSQENKQDFLSRIRKCEDLINKFDGVYSISVRAMAMLQLINAKEISYARSENMRHLLQLLDGKIRIVPGIDRCLNGSPFSLPVLVDNRDLVQQNLAKMGVYAPVLWPICDDAQKVCPVSKMMGEQMLSIPIDQRYNWNDIELIAERISAVIGL